MVRGKMVHGITTRLRGSSLRTKHQFLRPTDRLIFSYTFFLRNLSTLGAQHGHDSVEALGRSIDQSFTATHEAPYGRVFKFATVVARTMKKGESPVKIWEQACALVGDNPPTLAVAFVSKPTDSALRTVQALAGCFSASLSKTLIIPSPSSPLSETFDSDAGPQAGRELLHGAEHVPLIGCIMDDLGPDIGTSDNSGARTFHEDGQGSNGRGLVYGSLGKGDHRLKGQEADQVGFKLGSIVSALDSSNESEEDEDVEDGTVSDWEAVYSQCGEEVNKTLDTTAQSDDDEDDCQDNPPERISKEGLVSFLNALVRHKRPLEDFGGEFRGMNRREENVEIHRTGVEVSTESHRSASGAGLVTKLERGWSSSELEFPHSARERLCGSNGLTGHYENTITVEPRNVGDKAGVFGSGLGKQEGNYRLVLCVGHMPGVKVLSFHSSTTGLPRLPDLENAVLENNPHMLLLGAPGFVFPEFMQRLNSVFPASCRAGAFLTPLFTKKVRWTTVAPEKEEMSPLFFGDQVLTSGVVGLAISSKEKGLEVPVGAFAEFVQMSLGMARIQGYSYLDEAISKSLFLPDNNVFFSNSLGSSSYFSRNMAPSSLLEKLNQLLLKHSKVPSHLQEPAGDRPADPSAEFLVAAHPPKSQSVSSSLAEERPRKFDKLPLALLDSILFPGWSTPFFIYEPCYRLMVRQCLEQRSPFGLASVATGSWVADAGVGPGEIIGTLVNLKVHTWEEDCRSYIIAKGVRRFRVVNQVWSEPRSFGLTTGQVHFFDDKECETAQEKQELLELAKRAVSLCCEVVPEAQSAPGLVKSALDPRLASFAIGHVLSVPTRVKRRWLRMVDTRTRLSEQMTFLDAMRVPMTS